ncbi:MAG TPA: aminotransferase class III-fold pyridoxal phosphate-dependent enzyme [Burkholderiales bacterium]|nr:aminotransferase class III-fold pyridoxal phosphate-dependent enzyme [Burkholderiales bacterium]
MLVCRDRADALRVLQNADPKRAFDASAETPISGVAFLFPGQGAQQVNMGRTLYREERRFREEVDECSAVLAPHIGSDLRRILYPETGGTSAAEAQLTQTAVTQPALFVVEYALARLWASWGIEPAAMIGHSLGEYVAACLAGVFRRDDALLLLARRARMMQALPSGAMLAVRSSAEAIRDELTSGTALAALNAPNMTVVAGEHEAIAALEARLAAREIECRRLSTSHAFHSPMMEPITREFAEFVASVPRGPPAQRWISSLTGEPITDAQAIDPDYWARQMRHPVRYMDGIGKLLRPELALLEVGPGQALVSLARQHPDRTPAQLMIASLHGGRDGEGDLDALLMAAGRLWSAGLSIDWSALHAGSQRSRVSLPAYPFERTRYWVEPSADSARQDPQPATANPSAVPDTFMPDTISNAPAPQSGSAAALLPRLQKLFSELSGIAAAALEPGTSFLDLGLDSLFLTQVSNALNKQFGAQVSMRALLDEYSTLDALAGHLAPLVTPEPAPARPPATAVSPSGSASRTPAAAPEPAALPGTLQEVLAQQLELMSRQLEVLRNAAALGSASPPAPPVQQPVPEQPAPEQPAAAAEHRAPVAFGPYRPPSRTPASRLSAEQDRHLRTFIDRYAERTAGSKRYTAEHRAHLADPRTVAGFRPLWKEIVYPIVVNRSAGARLWDVDGNEYVDLTNGFGTILFGHNPEFVRGAIEAQLRQGIETGPQTPLAGEVAHLICEMTGMARAAFCSTGSEAVTAAIRVARTISGRDRIVLFSGAYHGIFDEVLVRPTLAGGARRAMPIAPGIPASMSDNVVVLEYGTPESLEAIRSMGRELAAVLVEPVQSRRPEFQPRDFLRELRKITADAETALVFDEVVTGFRSHPGGAQALFGVRADIATYGKVIGGGLPIGVVAGCPRYLDALDGGDWRYGDDSSPEVGVTFFAGTFVRHPIALCVARAVLSRLKQEGPELQRALNLRTTRFVETLNRHAEATGAPVRIAHFASWFCVNLPHELPFASLFFAHMRAKGVHIWEGRPAFLTLAHSDEVLARVTDAFRETLREMQAAGFLPGGQDAPPVRGARKGRDASGRPAWFIPDPDRTGKYLQIQETAEAQ